MFQLPSLMHCLPEFRPPLILYAPFLQAAIRPGVKVRVGGDPMGTAFDHRRSAEECVAMARLSDDNGDKALWLALAQSWVKLAEHVSRIEMDAALHDEPLGGEEEACPS
jgi:hypothetical protein